MVTSIKLMRKWVKTGEMDEKQPHQHAKQPNFMLTVSEVAGGAELHLKKRQSGTADSLPHAALLLQKRLRCSEDVFGKTCWSRGMKGYI